MSYKSAYPSHNELRTKAKSRIPKFAFDYLDSGCNEEVNLRKNTRSIRKVELVPNYLHPPINVSLETEILGNTYASPFGIAPIGLQGMMWPKSPEILAKASVKNNIPFILSTVTTADIETIGRITEGKFWFQLYHPAEDYLRDDLLKRAENAGCKVLVLLCDVPTFGYRHKDIKNGLAMPPSLSIQNILQILKKPNWWVQTLIHGQPNFATLKPYMPKNMDLKALATFMDKTFEGKLWEEKIKIIRDKWKGKIVLKGVASPKDAETALGCGLDGIIVSNHGGRQIDAGESSINSLKTIVENYKGKMTIMMDSGIRDGVDVARTLASGADFSFLGRTFMYGVCALGSNGGNHTIEMLNRQLLQIMEQVGCSETKTLSEHLKF